ncbi:MAG: hypothetical protein A2806_03915 [Candidatus Terrybacteria bacterium RIFCSPHIGHO2_01_FULL_48_17]|uniref:Uncharacterized protein n=1 Tax=Candidatus Terrybacteria bacterium RIFCSPHIGHO2_01_FULL_48_17 TaxID=1802362 RepID=A0A1G2PKG1_9BACT|nr:MAG: hypothetical protein A2806_03915 [Candidatus Terrybacteria bacterium RIFCSPHIGHO2_01_FULL_48_17]OHA53296.1 MAG: hypothetical protein A3A30_03905 [Candidatus Terrybacteria bacterium RIFCSPLOWO2_01_FULL_48_14]
MQLELDFQKTLRRSRDALNKLKEGNSDDVETLRHIAEALRVPVAEEIPEQEIRIAEACEKIMQINPALPGTVTDILQPIINQLPRRFEVWEVRDDIGVVGREFLDHAAAHAYAGGWRSRYTTITSKRLNVLEMRRLLAHTNPAFLFSGERKMLPRIKRLLYLPPRN